MADMPAKIWIEDDSTACGMWDRCETLGDVCYIRADLVEQMAAALRAAQSALAMIIEPSAIKSTSVLHAFTQATEAECRARAALSSWEAAQ